MLNGEFVNLFAKACRLLPELEYIDERFREGDDVDKAEIIRDFREEFDDWYSRYVPDELACYTQPDDEKSVKERKGG
jgi:hypothetical protein